MTLQTTRLLAASKREIERRKGWGRRRGRRWGGGEGGGVSRVSLCETMTSHRWQTIGHSLFNWRREEKRGETRRGMDEEETKEGRKEGGMLEWTTEIWQMIINVSVLSNKWCVKETFSNFTTSLKERTFLHFFILFSSFDTHALTLYLNCGTWLDDTKRWSLSSPNVRPRLHM